jgi:hypothetical protein
MDSPLDKLKRINSGGSRELYIKNSETPLTVVKTLQIASIFDSEKTEVDIKNFLKQFIQNQRVAIDIFHEMYVPSRFPKIIKNDTSTTLVTHEKLRKDLYPSSEHKNVTDLCFANYMGMYDSVKKGNLDFILSCLSGSLDENTIGGIDDSNSLNNIRGLQMQISSNESVYQIIKKYLNRVDLYKQKGLAIDLVGQDNVVLHKIEDNFEIIINNSAVKGDKIDTFTENLNLQETDTDFNAKITDLKNQVAMIININLLCHLTDHKFIFQFDSEVIEKLQKILSI